MQMQRYILYEQNHAITITVFCCNHFFSLENEMHKTESRYRNGQTHFLFYHPQRRVGVKCWKTICHRPAPLASQIQLTTQHIERLTAMRVANISGTHTHTHTNQHFSFSLLQAITVLHSLSTLHYTRYLYRPPCDILRVCSHVVYLNAHDSDVFIRRGLQLLVGPASKNHLLKRTHQSQTKMDSSKVFRASVRVERM